jgi:hypothetical protein
MFFEERLRDRRLNLKDFKVLAGFHGSVLTKSKIFICLLFKAAIKYKNLKLKAELTRKPYI